MFNKLLGTDPNPGKITGVCLAKHPSRLSLPLASTMCGSTPCRYFWGVTRWHALGRAVKWAQKHGYGEGLIVHRFVWGDEELGEKD